MANEGERYISNPFFADEGESVVTYAFTCPSCGREITILVPEQLSGKSCQGTGCPKCSGFLMTPVCDEQIIDQKARRIYRKKLAHNELLLYQDGMGAFHPYPLFSLYPLVTGESEEERRLRILGYALEKCDGIMTEDEKTKITLLKRLINHSMQLNAVVPEMMKLYAAADSSRREEMEALIDAVTNKTTGEKLLSLMGRETSHTASINQTEQVTRKVEFPLLQNNAPKKSHFSEEAPQTAVSGKKFCTECGCKLDSGNKFCPECGTKL